MSGLVQNGRRGKSKNSVRKCKEKEQLGSFGNVIKELRRTFQCLGSRPFDCIM
jgi:hypothetical protein